MTTHMDCHLPVVNSPGTTTPFLCCTAPQAQSERWSRKLMSRADDGTCLPLPLGDVLHYHTRLLELSQELRDVRQQHRHLYETLNRTPRDEPFGKTHSQHTAHGTSYATQQSSNQQTRRVRLRCRRVQRQVAALKVALARLETTRAAALLPPSTTDGDDDERDTRAEDEALRALRSVAMATTTDLATVRRRLVEQLLSVFPIKPSTDGRVTMRGFEIPSVLDYTTRAEEFSSNETWLLGTSLGFVAHFAVLMARYLDIPLQRHIGLFSSHSTIREPPPTGALLGWTLRSVRPPEPGHLLLSIDVSGSSKVFSLFEPLYYFASPSTRNTNVVATFPFEHVDLCLRWPLGSSNIQAVMARLRRHDPSAKLVSTPSGLHFREAHSTRKRSLGNLSASSRQNGRGVTSRSGLTPPHHHGTGLPGSTTQLTPSVVVRPPLHPAAVSSVYTTISQGTGVSSLGTTNGSSGTPPPSNAGTEAISRSLITYDPISLTLSLLGLGASPYEKLPASFTGTNTFTGLLLDSHSPSGSSFLAGRDDGELPLFLRSSTVLDRTKFAAGLRTLWNTIHQLAWEYENDTLDTKTRFETLVKTVTSRIQVSRLTPGVQLVELRESSDHLSTGDDHWESVSLLQPLVTTASAARRRGTTTSPWGDLDTSSPL